VEHHIFWMFGGPNSFLPQQIKQPPDTKTQQPQSYSQGTHIPVRVITGYSTAENNSMTTRCVGQMHGLSLGGFSQSVQANAGLANFVLSALIHNRSSILFGITRPLCTGNHSEVYQARTLQPASVGLLTHTYMYVHFQHNRLWCDYGSSLRSQEIIYVAIM